MTTLSLRRSLRINACTNRCSPRLSRCSYGSKYTYRTSPHKKNSDKKPNPSATQHTTPSKRCSKLIKKDQTKSSNTNHKRVVSPYSYDEIVLKVLRSRPIIIKKEFDTKQHQNYTSSNCSQTTPKKQLDTKQENFMTPKRSKRGEIITPPPSLLRKLDLDNTNILNQQENKCPMTPQKKMKEMNSPPALRRSNRKICFNRNEYLARKYLDFDLFAAPTTTLDRGCKRVKRVTFSLPTILQE